MWFTFIYNFFHLYLEVTIFITLIWFQKRSRDEVEEMKMDPIGILKEVGQIGKGFVKSVHLLKAPKFGQHRGLTK
jgi:hypothetical protein